MTDIDLTVHPPNPTYVSIVAAVIRGVLQIASGLGFAWGAFVSGDQVMMIATAAVMVGTLLWSAYQKIQAMRQKERAAIASAVTSAEATVSAGQPVAIAITNPRKAP